MSVDATVPPKREPFEHLVQFYESDKALADKVCPFIGAALGAGESAVIIAAKEHRALFRRILQAHVGVSSAEKAGRFLILDADETLSKFMRGGMPDPDRFSAVVGKVVSKLTKGGRRLRAYGEMVAILQAQGNVAAAIRLEELWNELGERHRFSLYCAYPLEEVEKLPAGPSRAICDTHSHVVPPAREGAKLPAVELMLKRAGSLEAEIQERVRIEAELRRSREELRSIVENATVGLHWVGPDGVIQWANAADHEMLGYAREEYIGQNIEKFHADKAVIEDILARLTRGERLVDVEARLLCKDGSIKIVLIDSSVLWDNGRFLHTQCFTRDVTEQRKAENASRRLAAIVEYSDDAIYSEDLEGRVLTWNGAAERLYGYRAEEIIGRSIRSLSADAASGQVEVILSRITAGERVSPFETVRKRKDGSLVDVLLSVSPLRDEHGRIVGASRVARDITEQKRNLEAVRKAQDANRYLAEVIESADTAIMGADLACKINAWNSGAERMFGYTKTEILGRPLQTLAPADRRSEPVDVFARIKAGEAIEPYETVRVRRDGTPLRVSIKVSPVRSSDGSILGGSAIIRDITAERAAQAALEEARRELARSHDALEARVQERTASLLEAVAQMEEFSYTVSHDLRAPLRAMQAYSKALLSDFGEALSKHPEATTYLNKIAGNAKRLDRMILDVLTFSRMARSEMRMQRVALDRLVRETIEHYPNMQEPQALVRVAPLSDVVGHEPSITQAISNLLTNAVKFVPAGTRPEVKVWTEVEGGNVRLCVQDNGIGIEPEFHGRLFRMFERIHPDLPYEGTGVGLAIVRRAVERMGGRVGVESSGKGGSRFWVELKAAERA